MNKNLLMADKINKKISPTKNSRLFLYYMMFIWTLIACPPLLFAKEEQITLNFKNADIRSIAEMVSRATGKNFIFDPSVKGNVTVVSAMPVPVDALYDTFLSILAVHGLSAVTDGNVVRIIPEKSAVSNAEFGNIDSRNLSNGEMLVTVIPVHHIDASRLVPLLRPLVAKNGHLASSAPSNVLIVADTARGINRLTEVLKTIDRENNSEIMFFPLQHSSASKVANAIKPLLKNSGKAEHKVAVTSDDRTNTLMVSGADTSMIQRLRDLIRHLDTATEETGDTRVVFLNYAKSKELADILRKFSEDIHKQKQSSDKNVTKTAIGIQSNDSINALLITAKPDDMQTLMQVIKSMDIQRAQVLVESLIVEISDDTARKLGIQWLAADNRLIDLSKGTALSSQALTLGSLVARFSAGDNISIGVLARALENDADANIISTPSLITMDNKEAEITVGREVPFVTGSYTSTGSGSNPTNPFNTIQRSNVGLSLKILPQISKGSVIRMDIEQEISNLLPGAAAEFGATDLVTSVRSLKTSVSVSDGNMLVLGGLVDDRLSEVMSRTPLLGDIPVLGELFTYRETKKDKRNLMIFIRPRILRDSDSSWSLSKEKYEQIRKVQLDARDEKLRDKKKSLNLLPYNEISVIESLDAKKEKVNEATETEPAAEEKSGSNSWPPPNSPFFQDY